MAWTKVVTESDSGKIAQEAATLLNQGALATLDKVDSGQITNGSIDTAHIANDQITSALMADNSVDSDMYIDASIDTAHIGNDQITNALMADGAVAGDIIADEQITQGKLADNSVITANITDANITLAKMADDSVGEATMKMSNTASDGLFLQYKDSTDELTWATPTDVSTVANLTDTTITSSAASEILFTTGANAWANKTLAEAGIQPLDADLTSLSSCQSGSATALALLTSTEVEILDGLTADTTELNYVDGVTSAIQTQLDAKQASGTYYNDTLNSTYWNADAARAIGSSEHIMDFAGDVTVSEDLIVDGASTLTGAVTIAGNLTVNGTTTTISTANLEVEDKEIVLGTPDSAYADDALAATGANGGGISLYTDSSGTVANFAKMGWSSTGELTGWTAEDTQDSKFPIAVMEFSSNSTAPTGNAGGVGSFHFDSGNDLLYIRTS